ncbi:uncharacterized protein APUU_61363A [Aspergillus puulaauensis]|uniref:Uncharacterized protein n=1 Tax=Aspergillus puulaauensis TaxID=1220207 RepID=A0A7R8AT21_9EURO|nr:uncharacterized protein APUU_61363A [Aspergillus puulaauensis]BCS28315.1 hypothetical protein APUU_61363A [Aspergillus puulaauensis]
MTAAPTHSGHGYKVGLICAVDATELAVTAILDDVHPTFTSRVDSASMAPSPCHDNCVFAFKQAGKCWLQRTDTNQDMEGVPHRYEASGELKGPCFEMTAAYHLNELACAVTSYLSDLQNHRSEHQCAEMAVARRIELLSDVRKIMSLRVAKRGDRMEFADISAATQASYVLDMEAPDTEKANSIFVGPSPDEGLTGQREIPVVGSCMHKSSDTQEYPFSGPIYIYWETTPRFLMLLLCRGCFRRHISYQRSYHLNSGVRSTSNYVRQQMRAAGSNSHRTVRSDFIPCETETATEGDADYS